MLTESRRQDIKVNLAYAEYKMERGEISHYHVYKQYVDDVKELLRELDEATEATAPSEMEERADEIMEEQQRICRQTGGNDYERKEIEKAAKRNAEVLRRPLY